VTTHGIFGRASLANQCPVLGVKQPCRRNLETAELDPKRTLAHARAGRRSDALKRPSKSRERPSVGDVKKNSTGKGMPDAPKGNRKKALLGTCEPLALRSLPIRALPVHPTARSF
jgi:hypothetical protein